MASPAPEDPFTLHGGPVAGQPWILPTASQLAPLPKGSPGYGCNVSPLLPVGAALYNWSDIASPADACPRGFFCPYFNISNPDTVPVACPATADCTLMRLYGNLCLPQGRYEPIPCRGGFYCPDYKTVLPCPEGYFCPTGTTVPRPCQFLSSCPAGTTVEAHFGLLTWIVAVDILFAALLFGARIMELRRWNQPWTNALFPFLAKIIRAPAAHPPPHSAPASRPVVPARSEDIEMQTSKLPAATVDGDGAEDTSVLVDGFRRGFAGVENVRMDFQFSDLGLTLPSGKTVLKGVNGQIKGGTMTAIMGPSGAGKTTFMSVLMGKVKRTRGELKINGMVAEMETFRKIIGYVPQEDVMLRELTVRENIEYAARVRLPSSWAKQDIDSHIDNVLTALNLNGVANSQIGDELTRGISGGQRKRVNIGLELAAVPLAIFLDEPTSGLDATAALDVALNLRAVARLGLTVVSVIHQPRVEIFETFDEVLMIAPGGRTAYLGPVRHVQQYFEALGFYFLPSSNPADVLMDILMGKGVAADGSVLLTPDDIVAEWERSGLAAVAALRKGVHHPAGTFLESGPATSSTLLTVPAPASSSSSASSVAADDLDDITTADPEATSPAPLVDALRAISTTRGAGFWKQVLLAHNRAVLQQRRFMNALWLELFVALFAGFVIGIASSGGELFKGVLNGPMALLSSATTDWNVAMFGLLIGIAVALAAAPPAVKVFGEEKSVYFREAASGHGRFAYYVGKTLASIYRILLASGHFSAVFYLLCRPTLSAGMQFLLVFLNFYVVYGVSAITSMLVPRTDAPLLSVIVGLILAVFCGFGPSLDETTRWAFGVSGNRWAAEAQFVEWIRPYGDVYNNGVSAGVYGYQLDETTRAVLAMVVLGVVYRVIGFVLMIGLNRSQQR
ncbi:hypothetical protein DFJ73DRAFT_796357 [Zopfochytrium polystomum]|nr:hypothetical protein DFJ73DRAFT_796357 [Zopfochytrium polystomum]